jgi:catechol 2,3-dioxygenase-like lactoylglutathione lyase family enzyme
MRGTGWILVVLSLSMCLLLSSCREGISTVQILHGNINCSDLERSIRFYEKLGFLPSLETDLDVPAGEAAGLGMPPYRILATPKMHLDGYVIDLIQWIDPYDPSAPYALVNHLGLSRLTLETTNLDIDMATLEAEGVPFFSEPVRIDRPVPNSRLVCFKDPDGTLIELVELAGSDSGKLNPGGTYITGALRTNVNCSDLDRSRSFYEMLGFVTKTEYEEVGTPQRAAAAGLPSYHVRASAMVLPSGHGLNLTKWEEPYDPSPPYALVNHMGIARIAILTANLDADISLLKAQGVQFYSEPIRPTGPFGVFRFVCFEDPDGTIIELVGLY